MWSEGRGPSIFLRFPGDSSMGLFFCLTKSKVTYWKMVPRPLWGSFFQTMWNEWVKLLSRVQLFATLWTEEPAPGSSVHGIFQAIFPTQGSNPGLPHSRQTLYCLSHQGSPKAFFKPQEWPLCSKVVILPWPRPQVDSLICLWSVPYLPSK